MHVYNQNDLKEPVNQTELQNIEKNLLKHVLQHVFDSTNSLKYICFEVHSNISTVIYLTYLK